MRPTNDASTDTTIEVLQALSPQLHGELILVTNEVNSGDGPTALNAYPRALDTGADWILHMDEAWVLPEAIRDTVPLQFLVLAHKP